MLETKDVKATPKNDKVITPEFNYGEGYGTVYVRDNIKQIEVIQGTEEEPNIVKMWQYDEKQYTFEEYVVELNAKADALEEDNKLTKSAIDTLMMMAMENTMPMITLSAEEISSDRINTKQKGEDTMAAYIAKRCIDLETEKEGAGKDYYRLYLSSSVWGKYKEDVDFILADLGRADLIVEL